MIDVRDKFRKIGQMDKEISIYRITPVTDMQGGYTESTALLMTVWARIEPMGGNRSLQYAQLFETQGCTIYIRKPETAITPRDYIVYGSKTLIIYSVIDQDEQGRYSTIIAYEKQ
jgi:SPP1 family predicted phage head-tail adaptor